MTFTGEAAIVAWEESVSTSYRPEDDELSWPRTWHTNWAPRGGAHQSSFRRTQRRGGGDDGGGGGGGGDETTEGGNGASAAEWYPYWDEYRKEQEAKGVVPVFEAGIPVIYSYGLKSYGLYSGGLYGSCGYSYGQYSSVASNTVRCDVQKPLVVERLQTHGGEHQPHEYGRR